MSSGQLGNQTLIERHHPRLVGWFRARIRDRDIAEDLAQQTWVDILHRDRIDTFDESRGTFWTFTKIWAGFVLQQYRSDFAGDQRRLSDPVEPIGKALPEEGSESASPQALNGLSYEDRLGSYQAFFFLLGKTLSCRRLPHEVLAFCLVKLLDWKPQAVVAELSGTSLAEIADQIETAYRTEVWAHEVRAQFAPLRARMALALGAIEADPRVLDPYRSFQENIVANTRFSQYYPEGDRPEEAVVRWWTAVGRSVRQSLSRETSGSVVQFLEQRRERRRSGVATKNVSSTHHGG